MKYFTTMNLPAPTYEHFEQKLNHYRKNPSDACNNFESSLCKFFEVRNVCTLSNCFTALSLSVLYASKDRPQTVAIAGLAYRRTSDIVLWAGLRPVFIDNDPFTMGMSLDALEDRLKIGNVGCVLVQHPMVNICKPSDYINLCNAYDVPLVFDSVEATGGRIEGKRIANHGSLEGFSLHPSKVINGAEGGVLTFGEDEEYFNFKKFLSEIGVYDDSHEKFRYFGLEPIHAIMGHASIESYPVFREKFKTHYFKYKENLKSSEFYNVVEYDLKAEPNFKSVLVELTNYSAGYRAQLLEYLEAFQIGARPYYYPLHSLTKEENLPTARRLAERYIFLPIGHSVSLDDIGYICSKLLDFADKNFNK